MALVFELRFPPFHCNVFLLPSFDSLYLSLSAVPSKWMQSRYRFVELYADFDRSDRARRICTNEAQGRNNPDSYEVYNTLMY